MRWCVILTPCHSGARLLEAYFAGLHMNGGRLVPGAKGRKALSKIGSFGVALRVSPLKSGDGEGRLESL